MFGRQPNPVFTDAYRRLREVLRDARQSAGISQRALAKRIGKSASHVSMIETGQRRVDVLEFHTIASSLGADPVQLFREATTTASSRLRTAPDA